MSKGKWTSWFTQYNAHRISSILWAVFLQQYVIWFSEMWEPATTKIVTLTLIGIMLIELIIPKMVAFKLLLHVMAVLLVNAYVLDYRMILFKLESMADLLLLLDVNASQILPYFWFAAAAAFCLLFVIFWSVSKARTIFLVFVSVVAFCIVDSFTFLVLWEQIGLMIVSGLMLVVIQHFQFFKRKHPESWSYLREFPGVVIVPVVALISVMVIAGAFAPNVKPLVMDPYTAWQNFRGEPAFKSGKGFDLSGHLDSSNRPGLSSSSGYSRDDSELGGGFQYDYSEVMSITTDHRSYWRGETRSYYTGEGWENQMVIDLGGQSKDAYVPENEPLNDEDFWDTSKLETVENNYTVLMSSEQSYPVLFSAYRLENYQISEDIEELQDRIRWSAESEVLRWNDGDDFYPQSYTLQSSLPVVDPAGLRESYKNTDIQLADYNISEKYVQLPESLPQRVFDLTDSIVAEKQTVYDQVKSIETYLSLEFPYTNEPDLSKVKSEDFVDGFLFELQEGYCDYYSTAMVVMVRSLGIPARWVKGFSPGQLPEELLDEFIPEDELLNEDTSGTYVVRNADAHSWVEVYFPGYGWIPFEPTSGFALPNQTAEAEMDDLNLQTPVPDNEAKSGGKNNGGVWSVGWLWLIGAVLLLIVLLLLAERMGLLKPWRPGHSVAAANLNQKVIKDFDKFLRFAQRKGYVRKRDQTAREWSSYWSDRQRFLKEELFSLIQLFEQAKYSPNPIRPEQAQRVYDLIHKLREKIKS